MGTRSPYDKRLGYCGLLRWVEDTVASSILLFVGFMHLNTASMFHPRLRQKVIVVFIKDYLAELLKASVEVGRED